METESGLCSFFFFRPRRGPLLRSLIPRSYESKPSIGFQYRVDQGIIIIISLVAAKREFKHKSCVYSGNHQTASPFLKFGEHDTAFFPICQGGVEKIWFNLNAIQILT